MSPKVINTNCRYPLGTTQLMRSGFKTFLVFSFTRLGIAWIVDNYWTPQDVASIGLCYTAQATIIQEGTVQSGYFGRYCTIRNFSNLEFIESNFSRSNSLKQTILSQKKSNDTVHIHKRALKSNIHIFFNKKTRLCDI